MTWCRSIPPKPGARSARLRVYESLAAIDRPVDMVEVFRNSAALPGIAREADRYRRKGAVGSAGRAQRRSVARLAEGCAESRHEPLPPRSSCSARFGSPSEAGFSLANGAFFMRCCTLPSFEPAQRILWRLHRTTSPSTMGSTSKRVRRTGGAEGRAEAAKFKWRSTVEVDQRTVAPPSRALRRAPSKAQEKVHLRRRPPRGVRRRGHSATPVEIVLQPGSQAA